MKVSNADFHAPSMHHCLLAVYSQSFAVENNIMLQHFCHCALSIPCCPALLISAQHQILFCAR